MNAVQTLPVGGNWVQHQTGGSIAYFCPTLSSYSPESPFFTSLLIWESAAELFFFLSRAGELTYMSGAEEMISHKPDPFQNSSGLLPGEE